MENYSKDIQYFITKFGSCAISQIYLVFINFACQTEFIALLSLN